MIAIVDYQMSNLFSVKNALDFLRIESEISSDPTRLAEANGMILPGVGAFPEAMRHLRELDLVQPIIDFIESGRPFMGICLGFQLLFSESEEFGATKGLDVLEGKVKYLESCGSIRVVPHVGWNSLEVEKFSDSKPESNPLNCVNEKTFMYFVHSYYVEPKNTQVVLTTTTYDDFSFCSSVFQKNIFACQFHPERSGPAGLKILKNYFI
jgi:imidazole glycerol-phosphate synthase subunit HisH